MKPRRVCTCIFVLASSGATKATRNFARERHVQLRYSDALSSSEAITIITAGGNCGTLSYGLNNAGFRRDADTYDVTSRASLSMATNAMDGHPNVSPVIVDVELCRRRHPRQYRSRAEQAEELNTFRSSLCAGHEIYPVCSAAIGVSSILCNIDRM